MKCLYLPVCAVLLYLEVLYGQSPCTSPDGKSGDCKSIVLCDSIRSIANKQTLTKDEVEYLKRSACGFNNTIPKVCCPKALPMQNNCFTPESKVGQCVNIFNCDHIVSKLKSPTVTQEDKNYANSLRCQGPAPFSVCCGPPLDPVTPTPSPTVTGYEQNVGCRSTSAPPDPASDCCGQDETRDDRLTSFGGTAVAVDAYPWLALIEHKKDNITKLMCGGVLISGRYVLTAGHCVVGRVPNSGEPTNVRLGEYDTKNEGADCVEVAGSDGEKDCTDEPVTIPIEKIIPHPEYEPRNPLRRNDIAMLRMASDAPYTDFIRPICLPSKDVTLNFSKNEMLFNAGWGAVSEKILSSNIKLHVGLPYKPLEVCQQAYTVPNRRIKLWERQLCAGGEIGKDSCKGDSGGPLMYSDGNNYQVIGIVSFGSTPCGLDNVPGVYTKVFEYLTWIRENIQP